MLTGPLEGSLAAKQKHCVLFSLLAHFHKEILFRFLLVGGNRYQCRSSVKEKWRIANFQIARDTCTL